jgi:maltooligosyltrehalose trehalohydrolase
MQITRSSHVAPPRTPVVRRLPIGAEIQGPTTHFRVWAPAASRVAVVLAAPDGSRGAAHPLASEGPSGYFSGAAADVGAGARYWVVLNDGDHYADPASRFQPEGPHGPSEVVDPSTFAWTDAGWPGVTAPRIVYEMHIGTFTAEGTWTAAARELPALAALGISILEVMPVSDFPGTFGWGYDGVAPFAPTRLYGAPDDMRRFVNEAHRLGLAVVLDVVYNHFGPDGCRLREFSPRYFSSTVTEWGQALNFDGEDSGPVREFFIANAGYWIDEFHLDGLRLDATQAINDRTSPHIVADIAHAVRAHAAGRSTWVVGENEPQEALMLRRPGVRNSGLDALWNDDLHHSAMVALTGRREAYYSDYLGTPQEFISAARRGFLYQGQWYPWQKQPRGQSTRGLPGEAFVAFLQNHDQVANSLTGARTHQLTTPGKCRALTALLLLGPWTPMLFQGQEFAASAPFLFFADHGGELGVAVRRGRREFLSQFASMAGPGTIAALADPTDRATFVRCKLDQAERTSHAPAVALHRTLIALRRSDPAFHDRAAFTVEGAVLDADAFVLRFMAEAPGDRDRLLLVNLGRQHALTVLSEPLLSPYPRTAWRTIWSSEDARWSGPGIARAVFRDDWVLPAECAIVLAPDAEP